MFQKFQKYHNFFRLWLDLFSHLQLQKRYLSIDTCFHGLLIWHEIFYHEPATANLFNYLWPWLWKNVLKPVGVVYLDFFLVYYFTTLLLIHMRIIKASRVKSCSFWPPSCTISQTINTKFKICLSKFYEKVSHIKGMSFYIFRSNKKI